MERNEFLEYELTSDILCIGERTKKGTFKPCIRTIPFSTITGALREKFNNQNIYAVGKLDAEYLKNIEAFKQIHVYSSHYKFEDVAKVPLNIEFLTDVEAKIYVFLKNESASSFSKANEEFNITVGAFKSKGFGRCKLRFNKIIENPVRKSGRLQTRIPENQFRMFGITEVSKPVYGYLFEPVDKVSGKYVRAIFEGSLVKGYEFLIEEDKEYEGTQNAS